MSFTSCGFTRFNLHSFAQLLVSRSLLWFSMTWWQRYLPQNYFLSITALTLHLLFCSVRRSLCSERKYTHIQIFTNEILDIQCLFCTKNPCISWRACFTMTFTNRKMFNQWFKNTFFLFPWIIEKQMVLAVFCFTLLQYSSKYVKHRFNISHTTIGSTQTCKNCKKWFQLKKEG